MKKEPNLLVGITGSISVLSLPPYLAALQTHYPNLKIIITHSANQLIPKETFHMFSQGIYASEFPLSKENMGHVELARWADLFLVMPATANILAEAAHGLAGSLLSAAILAYERKIIFIPNMNRAMWLKPATQRNVAQLKEDGHTVIAPIENMAYEYASRKLEMNPVIPSVESILSIIHLENEMLQCQTLFS